MSDFKNKIFLEPELEFGDQHQHPDPRLGLLQAVPVPTNLGDTIKVGVVGSALTVEKSGELLHPYKCLYVLVEALADLPADHVHLSVVGEFWTGFCQTQLRITELGIADRFEVVLLHMDDAEAVEYFARADSVLQPCLSASDSGVLGLAHWYGCPIIASEGTGLVEAVEPDKTGWLFPTGDGGALARLMADTMCHAAKQRMKRHLDLLRTRLTWSGFAVHLLQAIESVPERSS